MTAARAETPTAGRPTLLSRRHVRVAVGVLWLVDAALQAQPDLFGPRWWHDDLAQSVMGQPAPIARSILWAVGVVAAHAALWNAGFVAAQATLGLCLLTGRFERAAIVASIPWAVGIWWVGEGLGTLPTGFGLFAAAAPGAVLFYPLLAVLAWPRRGPRGDRCDRGVSRGWAAGTWAALWVGGALLLAPWKFSPGQVIEANLNEFSIGKPTGLSGVAVSAYHVAGNHPATFAVLLGVTQAAVGAAALYRPARRVALAGGIVVSLIFWEVFQGLGGVLAGDATDPGAGPLVILLALALWPAERAPRLRPAGPGPQLSHRRLTARQGGLVADRPA